MTEETAPQPAARYVEEEVAAPPPRRPLLWPWFLLLLLLVAGALVAAFLLTRDNGSKPRVPDVVGLSTAAAVRELGQRGYSTDVQTRTSSGGQVDRVLSQAPEAGTKLDRGSRVTIVVSRGPGRAAVPNVVGLSVDEAFVRLQAAGLKGKTAKVRSDRPKDTVLRQSPPAGAQAKKGATVLLTISKGAGPLKVPPVVGLTQASATATLERLGFRVSVSQTPSAKPKGIVVSQSPAAGTTAPKGSPVGINVSKGGGTTTTTTTTTTPTGTPLPNVVGMGQLEAVAKLEAAGMKVDSYPARSSRPRGTVVSQQPAAGTRVAPKTLVRIDVAMGSGQRPLRFVPDVTGQKETDARRTLVQAGFTVRTIDRPTNDPAQADTVLDQKPGGGNRAPATSQVLIFVARVPSASG